MSKKYAKSHHEFHSCTVKGKYLCHGHAHDTAIIKGAQLNRFLKPYKCDYCVFWHIGGMKSNIGKFEVREWIKTQDALTSKHLELIVTPYAPPGKPVLLGKNSFMPKNIWLANPADVQKQMTQIQQEIEALEHAMAS